MDQDNPRERFRPTNGPVLGVAAVVVALGIAVLLVVYAEGDVPWPGVALAVFMAALSYAAMLRPAVLVEGEVLVLRNMLDTVRLPLAAVEEVAVQQLLIVRAGAKQYRCPAVGRSRRQVRLDDRRPADQSGDLTQLEADSYGLFVEQRIRSLAENARDRQGVAQYSKEQEALAEKVTRTWAVPEIAVLVFTAVAFVVLLVV